MNITKSFILLGLTFSCLFVSCDRDNTPIIKESLVTVTNTFEAVAITDGQELAIEDLFQVPAGSLAATATVTEDLEFESYLLGLYDIDLDRKRIKFEVAAQEGDATYGDLFRILEAGTTDRYYFTLGETHNVEDFKSDDSSVNLRVDSETVLVVEIGEGFDFKPGAEFTITLK